MLTTSFQIDMAIYDFCIGYTYFLYITVESKDGAGYSECCISIVLIQLFYKLALVKPTKPR